MLIKRPWVPEGAESYIQNLAAYFAQQSPAENESELLAFVEENRRIHEQDCFNLNPATNVSNPKAERLLSAGLGSRPSLGYPGAKYEMGLEGIEKIEVLAAELAAQVFEAKYVELRVPSGQIANLYAYRCAAQAGDCVFVPSTRIGGHASHQAYGVVGALGLNPHNMAVDAAGYTVDIDALHADAKRLKPKVITIGGSLNLFPHPLAKVREIADEVGAIVLYDAAHLCGLIAGKAWQQPLAEGAHLITMSTYKSLGGPAGGLIVTNEADIAEKLDAIAYPGMTANFDASKAAALAMTMLDWQEYGQVYAKAMLETAATLAKALVAEGLPLFARDRGITASHQFAIEAAGFGGGQKMAQLLRRANILSCGIGLPLAEVEGDLNGLRLGTPELVRWGMTAKEMPRLAALITDVLFKRRALEAVAAEVSAWRKTFNRLHFVR